MEISSVGAALDILSRASKALDSLREQSKASIDASLKENISRLYDEFIDLKAAILRLTDEVAALKAAPKSKPKLVEVGITAYYYLEDDKGPYCQPCYDKDNRLVPLMPRQEYAGGDGRKCQVCGHVFFENRQSISAGRGSRDLGPWG